MKKIYLSALLISTSIGAFSQQSQGSTQSNKRTAVIEKARYKPAEAMIIARGIESNYKEVYIPFFADSTVMIGVGTNTTTTPFSVKDKAVISRHSYGTTLDPKSTIYDADGPTNPNTKSITKNTAYTLDSIYVQAWYQRRFNTLDDTLIIDIVWGDTTVASKNIFAKYSLAAPLNTYGTFLTPLFSVTPNVEGNTIRFSAPNTNKKTIKYLLTQNVIDNAVANKDYVGIAVGQLIPADNIVSVNVTFNSAGTHTNGAFSFTQKAPAGTGKVSAWGAVAYVQNDPLETLQGFDDILSFKNAVYMINSNARYGTAVGTFSSTPIISVAEAPVLEFVISFDETTVGVKELDQTGFVLGQNQPNPYTNSSFVKYQLAKDFSNAVFTITDIMGRVISSENVAKTIGTHTVKLENYASGLYYYSLNIDGNVSTKKFIVE